MAVLLVCNHVSMWPCCSTKEYSLFLADIYIKTEFRSQLQLVLGGQHGRREVNIFEGERSSTIRVSKALCEDVVVTIT